MDKKDHRRTRKEETPSVAPGITEEALEAEATEQEVRGGDYTEVTRLEPASPRERED